MINKSRGFSLLEILVAFSIMAISLGILLKIFSSGVNTAGIAEEYTVATQIAESLMARTGIETMLIAGDETGIEAEKYHWRVNVEPLPGPETNEVSVLERMAVQVRVHWGGEDESNHRVVELNTIKTRLRQQ